MAEHEEGLDLPPEAVAIVGMSGRFPGADSVEELWQQLLQSREGISSFGAEELRAAGWSEDDLSHPQMVRAGSVLNAAESFDAGFFELSPREAKLMDPQHRLALEAVWHALEDAGYTGEDPQQLVGVFAGCGPNTYLMHLLEQLGGSDLDGLQLTVGNEKDYLATRIAYKLNLSGPAVSIQTACSTSLVAVHMACQSLLGFECDVALAGGVSVRAPQPKGYMHQPGSILSADGHCRPFDAAATGTVYGNGLGFVVLRRLEDAVEAGDRIVAVIRGSAINNDGAAKVGYTAPSIEGQATVVRRALAISDLEAADIGYVEAHGTGTLLGDPIEIAALRQIFGEQRNGNRCLLGAVKSNLGHLDTAAGVAGLIKTALVVERGVVPATLHFQNPNPEISFERSPFRVVTERLLWPEDGRKRRAGVSSFGIGGTNAHVILEQSPAQNGTETRRPAQVIVCSAATGEALQKSLERLADHLGHPRAPDLADVAFTLQTGRRSLPWRASVVASDPWELIPKLRERAAEGRWVEVPDHPSRLLFLFPGQGSQYPGMGWDLLSSEPVFREALESCAEIHGDTFGWDLLAAIRSPGGGAARSLATDATEIVQPALFAVEYALACLWRSWGLEPDALLGHSVGEILAACLSGVFSLEDAVRLVGHRGAVMQAQPPGAMAAVYESREALESILPAGLGVAANNGPSLVTVAGPEREVDAFLEDLETRKVPARRLRVSHAFHSPLMAGALPELRERLAGIVPGSPSTPWISNVTGRWIEAEQARDLEYWIEHLRHPVLFREGLECVLESGYTLALEVGPGQSLAKLARGVGLEAFPSLPVPKDSETSSEILRSSLGKVWERGLAPAWNEVHSGERRLRVSLPGYPFARESHRIEAAEVSAVRRVSEERRRPPERWGHCPVWQQTPPARALETRRVDPGRLLILAPEPWLSRVATALPADGPEVIRVPVAPGDRESLEHRLVEIAAAAEEPLRVVCAWFLEDRKHAEDEGEWPELGALVDLCRLFAEHRSLARELVVLTRGGSSPGAEPAAEPALAGLEGFCRVVGQELPGSSCRLVDLGATEEDVRAALVELSAELGVEESDWIAYRGNLRYRRALEPITLEPLAAADSPWVEGGVYMITGGLGALGLELARHLARTCRARLALVTRNELPPADDWEGILQGERTDEDLHRRLQGLAELRELGAEVEVLVADVGSREDMARALEQTRDRLGQLAGVFHLAAVPGGGLLQIRRPEEVRQVLAPKVGGVRILGDLLAEDDPPFLVCFSSITAVIGGIGQGDYAAACSYLGAFAEARRKKVLTIDWDAWELDRWQQLSAHLAPAAFARLKEIRERFGIRLEEGFDVLQRMLRLGLQRVVISTRDPAHALQAHEQLAADFLGASGAESSGLQGTAPDLAQGEIEELVALIWREVLGLEEVDPHANFVDLGGHSLMAIQLVSRLGDALGTTVPLRVVFENPTVHRLATFLSAPTEEKSEPEADELERILDEVEGLSEEAAQARLEELLAAAEGGSGDSSP